MTELSWAIAKSNPSNFVVKSKSSSTQSSSLIPSQNPSNKYYHVKGKQRSEALTSKHSIRLPFDVPLSPYTKNGKLNFFICDQINEMSFEPRMETSLIFIKIV